RRQMLQQDNASKPGGKRVESKSGKPSTLRSSFLEDQSMTEQRTGGTEVPCRKISP
ncbi:hypothetical protein OS493_040193, partial [Desmophyllum pertusum]